MPLIGVGRYNRLLQKLLDMKATPPAPDLAGEVMPMLDLERALDWAYLRGEKLLGCGAQQAAIAAQPGLFRARMPAAAGVIAVVELLLLCVETTDRIIVRTGTATADLDTAVETHVRETRLGPTAGGTPQSALQMSRDNTGGAAQSGGAIAVMRQVANEALILPNVGIIAPGFSMDFATNSNNVVFHITMFWTERQREPSET